jgi:predicted phosphohydrolase
MPKEARYRIAMLHYPPIGPDHSPTKTTRLLEEAHIDICVFGHLHNIKPGVDLSATLNGIRYLCVSADYLSFKPAVIIY